MATAFNIYNPAKKSALKAIHKNKQGTYEMRVSKLKTNQKTNKKATTPVNVEVEEVRKDTETYLMDKYFSCLENL